MTCHLTQKKIIPSGEWCPKEFPVSLLTKRATLSAFFFGLLLSSFFLFYFIFFYRNFLTNSVTILVVYLALNVRSKSCPIAIKIVVSSEYCSRGPTILSGLMSLDVEIHQTLDALAPGKELNNLPLPQP